MQAFKKFADVKPAYLIAGILLLLFLCIGLILTFTFSYKKTKTTSIHLLYPPAPIELKNFSLPQPPELLPEIIAVEQEGPEKIVGRHWSKPEAELLNQLQERAELLYNGILEMSP